MRVHVCGIIGVMGVVVALATLPATAARPAPVSYKETVPGTEVAFEMIAIPAGEFLLGSPASEAGRGEDEGPQRKVRVEAFWMMKTEATWDIFDLFFKDDALEQWKKPPNPQPKADVITRPTDPYSDETFGHGREGKPVLGISHNACMMFARWLSQKTGKLYRLPTEAEWEYACRAGSTTAYPWGDDPAKLGDYAWSAANSNEDTHAPAEKKPNAFGLYDMLGTVAEWCVDQYDPGDYAKLPADKVSLRPVRLPGKTKFRHVIRGGSWADDAPQLRSAARRGSDKNLLKRDPQRPQSIWWLTEGDWVGFRLVRAVEEQPELKDLLPPVNWESKNYAEAK